MLETANQTDVPEESGKVGEFGRRRLDCPALAGHFYAITLDFYLEFMYIKVTI